MMEEKKENSYKTIQTISEGKERKPSKILVPLVSGVIGAGLTLGICFGVPQVRNALLGNDESSENSILPIINQSDSNYETTTVSYEDMGPSVAEKVLPSVVGIEVHYTVNSVFGGTGSATGSGSGIIISSDGYILTNNHVVSNTDSSNSNAFYQVSEANSVKVYLYGDNQTAYDAKIIGTDAETDLAIIKIEKDGLPAAELGNSDELKIGEWVMAIGNPLGLSSSISTGVVSAVNREVTDSDGIEYTLIQTDAAINEGNSGGALVNSKGQVIGINFMKISSVGVEGISFAIPITPAIDVSNELIQYNKVRRPYLGITGSTVTEQISKMYNLAIGVYVQSVDTFAKAGTSGLKGGDVITQIDGKEIKTMDELTEYIKSKNIGDTVTLKINRSGEELEIKCELSEQP